MNQPFVLFQVAGATYGARSGSIQQVEMVQLITRVPNAPDFVEGVTSIRGQVIPVISLRKRFHLEEARLTMRSRVIVFLLKDRRIGALVDSAREFIQIDTDQIAPVPPDLSGPGVEYLEGIVTIQDRTILVVNLPRLLNAQEAEALSASAYPQEDKQPD